MNLSHRRKRYLVGWGVMLLAALGIGIAVRALVDVDGNRVSQTVMIALMAALTAVGIAASLPWWRALDEMQKDAQRVAWFWGGTAGVTIGLISAVVIGGPQSELVQGALLVGGAQGVCFSAVWLGLRVIHRPRTS